MALYASIESVADDLIKQFGRPVTLTRSIIGTYNTATGSAPATISTQQGIAVTVDLSKHDIDGTLIRIGDKKVLMSTAGIATPSIDDAISIDGVTYSIVSVKPLSPGDYVIMYQLIVRGA